MSGVLRRPLPMDGRPANDVIEPLDRPRMCWERRQIG
jgi:hypothetical protein